MRIPLLGHQELRNVVNEDPNAEAGRYSRSLFPADHGRFRIELQLKIPCGKNLGAVPHQAAAVWVEGDSAISGPQTCERVVHNVVNVHFALLHPLRRNFIHGRVWRA